MCIVISAGEGLNDMHSSLTNTKKKNKWQTKAKLKKEMWRMGTFTLSLSYTQTHTHCLFNDHHNWILLASQGSLSRNFRSRFLKSCCGFCWWWWPVWTVHSSMWFIVQGAAYSGSGRCCIQSSVPTVSNLIFITSISKTLFFLLHWFSVWLLFVHQLQTILGGFELGLL